MNSAGEVGSARFWPFFVRAVVAMLRLASAMSAILRGAPPKLLNPCRLGQKPVLATCGEVVTKTDIHKH